MFHKWEADTLAFWFIYFLLNLDVVLWTKLVQFEEMHIIVGHGLENSLLVDSTIEPDSVSEEGRITGTI